MATKNQKIPIEVLFAGADIGEVAKKFGISRNSVSQIKTRIEKRIVVAGREMIAKECL